MIDHRWLYGRKWPSAPSNKKEIRSSQYGSFPRNLKFSEPLATKYEKYF